MREDIKTENMETMIRYFHSVMGTLKGVEGKVWLALAMGDKSSSKAKMANVVGCSSRTISRAVRSLEEKGLLEVITGTNGKANNYKVMPL